MAKIEEDNGGAWDAPINDGNNAGKFGPSQWLKLKERPEPYRVRLVSSPEPFRKHWAAFKSLKKYPVSPVTDPTVENKDQDIAWNEGGWVPGKRYASIVINRETGKLEILDAGPAVFKEFGKYKKTNQSNPAGRNGPDWLIVVGHNAQGQTEYTVNVDLKKGIVPFTPEEEKMIANCTIDLKKIYKKASSEEIRALWFQLPEASRINPKKNEKYQKSGSASAPAPATPAPAPEPDMLATAGAEPEAEEDGSADPEDLPVTTPAPAPAPAPAAATPPAVAPAAKPAPAKGTEKKAVTLF